MYRLRSIHGFVLTVSALLVSASSIHAGAQTYNSPDGGFSFTYPQRWEASDSNGAVKITAPDGSSYALKLDTIESAPTGSPVNDAGLKQVSAKIAAPIASGATFVRASSVSMDHGQGASFRYKSASGDTVDVWIGIIGKHNAVLIPAKAGQSGQTIGLSVIFQTMSFADALPKQPVRPAGQPGRMANQPTDTGAATSTRTVMFSKQIAPILSQRCVACHSSQSASGGLNVSSYSSFVSSGSRGSVVKPGNVAGSSLIDYLTGAKDQMPKGRAPLSSAQIDLFRTWIREGATNDLDPSSSGRSSFSGAGNATAGGAAARRRQNVGNSGAGGAGTFAANNGAGRAVGGPKPLESYAGHLASNDNSFTLRLYTNLSATASWTFDQPSPARYQGTYTNTAGVYTVLLNLVSGSVPGGSKSLKLVMQSNGTDAVGKFGLDTPTAKYKIMGLQLDEIDNATKNPNTNSNGAGAGQGTRKIKKSP